MANLHFKIGSSFDGEGFKKLQQAVKNVNQPIRAAASSASALSSAISGLDTSGSKCVNAMAGLVQSFAQGGVSGAAFSAVMMGINSYLSSMKERADEFRATAQKMGESLSRAINSTLSRQIANLKDDIDRTTKSFDRATSAAAAFQKAVNEFHASQGAASIINLEIAKFQAVLDATSTAEAKHAEAAYALKIQEEKNAQSNAAASQVVASVSESLAASERREAILAENRAKVEQEIIHLEEARANSSSNETKVRVEINNKLTELNRQLKNIEDEQEAQSNTTHRLIVEQQTAIQKETNARLAGEQAILALNAATQKEALAKEEAAKKEEERKAAKNEMKDAETGLQEAIKEESSARAAAAKAAQECAAAQKEYETALKNYKEKVLKATTEDALQSNNTLTGGSVINARAGIFQGFNTVQDANAHQAVEAGVAAGTLNTVRDIQAARTAAKREAREYMSSDEVNEMANDDAKAARLSQRSQKSLSKADQEWLADYNQAKASRDKENRELEEAKLKADEAELKKEEADRKMQEAQDAVIEGRDYIKKIKEKVDNLGLN